MPSMRCAAVGTSERLIEVTVFTLPRSTWQSSAFATSYVSAIEYCMSTANVHGLLSLVPTPVSTATNVCIDCICWRSSHVSTCEPSYAPTTPAAAPIVVDKSVGVMPAEIVTDVIALYGIVSTPNWFCPGGVPSTPSPSATHVPP